MLRFTPLNYGALMANEDVMAKAVFAFEVPEDKQKEYLKKTAEIIKPFWEAHECLSYEVYQDYFTSPRRFIKEQLYPDQTTMERSLSLARTDPEGIEIVKLFFQYAENVEQRRVVARIGKNGLIP